MERKPRSEHHSRRLRQQPPEATSRASQTPPTNRPMRTMRPRLRANGAMATPRPQRHTHRIPRVQPRQAVPCVWRTVQPQGSSQESTSHPALRQTTQPLRLRRTPLVSRGFWVGRRVDRQPKRFRTRPIPIARCVFFWWVPKLTGTSALIYLPRKKAKMILDVSHAIAFLL